MATEPKLTPVQELEQIKAQLSTVTAERDTLLPFKAQVIEANDKATARTTELSAERLAHAETKARLSTVEAELNSLKAEHKTLKDNFDAEVTKAASAKAAKVVADTGILPVTTTTTDKPGSVGSEQSKGKDRLKEDPSDLIARDVKAAFAVTKIQ